MSRVNRDFLAKSEEEVSAFHPGPAADFQFPEPEPCTAADRLAFYERRFLRIALELFADRSSDLATLARSIIVQRASIADASTKGKDHE